jgi:hypothetical protein
MPFVEYRQEYTEVSKRNREWHFGPRVGYVWDVFGNHDYFYWQSVVRYKNITFSPFWLRRYSKEIGYQVPTSIGLHFDHVELWANYVYHARTFDVHFVAYLK